MDTFVSRHSAVGSGGAAANERINPATEEQQADSLVANSSEGGCVKVGLTTGTGQGNGGVSLSCKSCMVKPAPANTADVTVNIGAAADGDDIPLDDAWNPIPIDDVSSLYFYSTDQDAIVYILYRE